MDVKDFPCFATFGRQGASAAEGGRRRDAARRHAAGAAAPGHARHRAGGAGQLNKAGFKVELKIPELGAVHPGLAQLELRRSSSRSNAGSTIPTTISIAPSAPAARRTCSNIRTPSSTSCSTTPAGTSMLRRARPPMTRCRSCLPATARPRIMTYGQLFTASARQHQGFDIIANRSLVDAGAM